MPRKRITQRKYRGGGLRTKTKSKMKTKTMRMKSLKIQEGGNQKEWIGAVEKFKREKEAGLTTFKSLNDPTLKIPSDSNELINKALVIRHLLYDLIDKDLSAFTEKIEKMKSNDSEEDRLKLDYLSSVEKELRENDPIDIFDKAKYPLYFLFLMMNVDYKEEQIKPQLFSKETDIDD